MLVRGKIIPNSELLCSPSLYILKLVITLKRHDTKIRKKSMPSLNRMTVLGQSVHLFFTETLNLNRRLLKSRSLSLPISRIQDVKSLRDHLEILTAMLRNVTQITALQKNSVTGDQAQTKVIIRGENDQISAIILLPPPEKT
jgi:hypothetical protein